MYNPLLETEYIPGGTPWNYEGEDYGSPIGTLWNTNNVNPIVPYGSWTWGSYTLLFLLACIPRINEY